jgi:hypothetical protein
MMSFSSTLCLKSQASTDVSWRQKAGRPFDRSCSTSRVAFVTVRENRSICTSSFVRLWPQIDDEGDQKLLIIVKFFQADEAKRAWELSKLSRLPNHPISCEYDAYLREDEIWIETLEKENDINGMNETTPSPLNNVSTIDDERIKKHLA